MCNERAPGMGRQVGGVKSPRDVLPCRAGGRRDPEKLPVQNMVRTDLLGVIPDESMRPSVGIQDWEGERMQSLLTSIVDSTS